MFSIPLPLAIGILAAVTGLWVLAVAVADLDEGLAEKGAVIAIASTLWCAYYLVYTV